MAKQGGARSNDLGADEQRRQQILDAAAHCFLQYGFAKTSMDDVAKKAGISRPAIYLKFKNKEDLFSGVYIDVVEKSLVKAELLVKESASKREKLIQLAEAAVLEPWSKIVGQPRAAEFYELCMQIVPGDAEVLHKRKLKLAVSIFADKETAEVFLMALEGFYEDLPSSAVLRKRIHFLIDKFLK